MVKLERQRDQLFDDNIDFFKQMRLKMETDAQVYVAYYWRKYNAQKKAAKKKKKGKKGKKKG